MAYKEPSCKFNEIRNVFLCVKDISVAIDKKSTF